MSVFIFLTVHELREFWSIATRYFNKHWRTPLVIIRRNLLRFAPFFLSSSSKSNYKIIKLFQLKINCYTRCGTPRTCWIIATGFRWCGNKILGCILGLLSSIFRDKTFAVLLSSSTLFFLGLFWPLYSRLFPEDLRTHSRRFSSLAPSSVISLRFRLRSFVAIQRAAPEPFPRYFNSRKNRRNVILAWKTKDWSKSEFAWWTVFFSLSTRRCSFYTFQAACGVGREQKVQDLPFFYPNVIELLLMLVE